MSNMHSPFSTVSDSIVASISACHADDPGSIPGRRAFFGLPHVHSDTQTRPVEGRHPITALPWLSQQYGNHCTPRVACADSEMVGLCSHVQVVAWLPQPVQRVFVCAEVSNGH